MFNEHPFRILFICFLISISFQGVVTAENQQVLYDYQHIYYGVDYTGNEHLQKFEHRFDSSFLKLSKNDNIFLSFAIPPDGENTFSTYGPNEGERPLSPNRIKRDSLLYIDIDTKVKENILLFRSISSNINYSFSQPIDIFWPPHNSQQFFKIVTMNESALLNLTFNIKILENVSEYRIYLYGSKNATLKILKIHGAYDENYFPHVTNWYIIPFSSPVLGEIYPYTFELEYNSPENISTIDVSIETFSEAPFNSTSFKVNGVGKKVHYVGWYHYGATPVTIIKSREILPRHETFLPKNYDISYPFATGKKEGSLSILIKNESTQDLSYVYGENCSIENVDIEAMGEYANLIFKITRDEETEAKVHLGIKSFEKVWPINLTMVGEIENTSTFSQYLKSEPGIEVDDLEIKEIARNVTLGNSSYYDKVASIYDYILLNFLYDYEKYDKIERGESPPQGAKILIREGKGVCGDFADLLVALCRASGIPARRVTGDRISIGNETFKYGLKKNHAWSEIYFPGYGWVEFDVTPSANAFGYIKSDHFQKSINFEGQKPFVTQNSSEFIPENSSDELKELFYRKLEEIDVSDGVILTSIREKVNSGKFVEASLDIAEIKKDIAEIEEVKQTQKIIILLLIAIIALIWLSRLRKKD